MHIITNEYVTLAQSWLAKLGLIRRGYRKNDRTFRVAHDVASLKDGVIGQ